MLDSEDKWPLPNYYITEQHKHIHALGAVSLTYNLFEDRWTTILAHYAGRETAEFLLRGRVSEQARMGYVRHYVGLKERDHVVRELLENAINCFSVCSENRNILMHSSHYFHRTRTDHLFLMKGTKSGATHRFHFHLNEIRGVADDIMEGYFRIVEILEFIEDRDLPHHETIAAPAPLPRTLLSPRKLSPAEILEAPQAVRPQPGSSGE